MSKNLEGVLVKRAHSTYNYNAHELSEFVKCADPLNGYEYFMRNYFYIQHPVKGKLLYKPFKYQEELIHNYHNSRFSISMLGRQMGKTTSAAGYLLWYGMFNPDATILIAAHKYSGAQEIMQRIRYAYESCPDFIRAGVVSYNKGSIEFDNGSRIVAQATTENTGRGMSITLLYMDEFAFVRPNIAKEFWVSISPTLATGGRAIITSTPNNDEDTFAQIWAGANKCFDEFGNETDIGVNGFRPYLAVWDAHPDRDEKWAREERGRIGDEKFKREHECLFVSADETLVDAIRLTTLSGSEPVLKQGQVRWYKRPDPNSTYVVALDPSLGTGGDNAAIQVYELPSLIQVAEWKHNKTSIQKQIGILREITKFLVDEIDDDTAVYYSVENNTLGEAALVVIQEIGEENIPGIFLSEPKRPGSARSFRRGFNTTNKSKLSCCAKLKSYIDSGKMTINSKSLITELKSFVANGASYAAKPGETDDLVMSTVLAVRMMLTIKTFSPDIEEALTDSIDDYIEPMPFIVI